MNPSLWLELRIVASRLGWTKPVVLAACLTAGILQWAVRPEINAQTDALRKEATRSAAQINTQPESPALTSLQAFTHTLTPAAARGDALKTIFAEADKAGLTLAQADYQTQFDSSGGFSKLQISLPVKGSYPKIRTFVGYLLTALPALSVDDISFRRDNIKSQFVEARIHLTLHTRGEE